MVNKNIVVWFSCGAASAVAAMKTLRLYGDYNNVTLVNNPVIEEDRDNIRFLHDVENWLDVKIETATNHKYPSCSAVDIWEKRAFMSGPKGAPCTIELKKQARLQYECDHDIDYHVLGFVKEEEKRFTTFRDNERKNTLPVLIKAGITKADCYQIIQNAGIELPKSYRQGYPNANCKGCVKATSPTYWNHVRKTDPMVFLHRMVQSRKIGAKLARVKGKRIYLDELKETDIGRPMKNLDFECGIFCRTQ